MENMNGCSRPEKLVDKYTALMNECSDSDILIRYLIKDCREKDAKIKELFDQVEAARNILEMVSTAG